jgi:Tfp pilus assembly pilus retraction ATPase PilT
MIDNIIQTSADVGMISMESYLAKLVQEGKITEEVALSYSNNALDFQNNLRKHRVI